MTIPENIKKMKHFVVWRLEPDPKGGKNKKVPYNAKTGKMASVMNCDDWSDFQTALDAVEKDQYDGIGLFLTKDLGIVGIDIDHCIDPETRKPNALAKKILGTCYTYAEYSPSGTGVHLLAYGKKPEGACKNTETGVEMYENARYLTLTGNRIETFPNEINNCNEEIAEIHQRFVAKQQTTKKKSEKVDALKESKESIDAIPDEHYSELTDEEVIEKATKAKNGQKFLALMKGDVEGQYPSQSEADLAFCRLLAFWTNKNASQMDRIFRESELFRNKWDELHDGFQTYGEMTIQKAIDDVEGGYHPPKQDQGNDQTAKTKATEIVEEGGCYYRISGDKRKPLTNFVIVPDRRIVSENAAQLQVALESANGHKHPIAFAASDFSNVRAFKSVLNQRSIDFSFFGSDSDLEMLKSYIATLKWDEVKGVAIVGIHEYEKKYVFACANGTMDATGEPTDAIAMLNVPSLPRTEILSKKRVDSDDLSNLGHLLTTYNDLLRTIPILAWVGGCFIKEHLASMKIKFPHLALIGEAGSGKSNTMAKIVLPFFALEQVTAAPEVTPFSVLHNTSTSNLLPYALDEYKPSKIDGKKLNVIHNMLRVAYDRHVAQRGCADRTLDDYQHVAPVVIAGEESPNETAIRERTIEIMFSKKNLAVETHRSSFQSLERQSESIGNLGFTLLLEALNTPPKECREWYNEGTIKVSHDLAPRMVNNISCCYAGLKLLEKVCIGYGKSFSDVFGSTLDSCANCIQTAVQRFMLDDGTHNKTILDETFEIMARMHCKNYWQVVENKEGRRELRMRLPKLYDQYTRYRREYGIIGEVLPLGDFQKQLKQSEVYMDNKTAKLYGKNESCWIVDFDKLTERCDVSGFLEKEVQSQGAE